jgi:hypothetical protein
MDVFERHQVGEELILFRVIIIAGCCSLRSRMMLLDLCGTRLFARRRGGTELTLATQNE